MLYSSNLNQLNSDIKRFTPLNAVFLHDQWITITMQSDQNILCVGHLYGMGDVVDVFAVLICAGTTEQNTGRIVVLAGNFNLNTNWNSGLSIGINADSNQWASLSILYL